MPRKRGKRTQPKRWTIPTPPPSYGELDDTLLVRHVRVPRVSNLFKLKQFILQAYEDQYTPEQITLFTRIREEQAVCVTTDDDAKRKLLGCHQEGHDPGPYILLIVSPMNETESKLLVMPAMHSPPMATILRHLAVNSSQTPDGDDANASLPLLLATATPSLFNDLPLPTHIDDWLAQYREVPQPACQVSQTSNPICLQPIFCEVAGQQSPPMDMTFFEALRAYTAAFFHGVDVTLRPALTVHVIKTGVSRGSGKLVSGNVAWRNVCPGNGEALPHGQLHAFDVLRTLRAQRGAMRARGNRAPCVLGVTMSDLFCGDEDVFTGTPAGMPVTPPNVIALEALYVVMMVLNVANLYQVDDGPECCQPLSGGLASLTFGVGVFSFHRSRSCACVWCALIL